MHLEEYVAYHIRRVYSQSEEVGYICRRLLNDQGWPMHHVVALLIFSELTHYLVCEI